MLRPSPNHGTQRLPNDDDEYVLVLSWAIIDKTKSCCGVRHPKRGLHDAF